MAKRKRRHHLPEPPSPPVTPGLVGPMRTVPAGIARPEYAATGVERISVGALTHSPVALDVSMSITSTSMNP